MDIVRIRNQFNGGLAQVDEFTAAKLVDSGWVLDVTEDKPAPARRTRRAPQKPAGDTNTKR